MKILLSITATMLAGALFWSYSQQKKESAHAPKEELARIEQQLAALAIENKNLENERRLRGLGLDLRTQELNDAASKEAAAKIAAANAAAAAAAEQAKALEDPEDKDKLKKLKMEEDGVVERKELEKRDKEFRNQNLINSALVMGRVTDFVDNAESGTFVVFNVKMPELIKVDTILAVRRNGGIAGYIKITSITGDEGIGDVLPGLGKLMPKVGEDLILDPLQ